MKNIDFRCEIENKTEDSVDIYLYGYIVDEKPINPFTGEEIEGDYIYPKNVRDMFSEAGDREINIHLNSKGGRVFASIPIHNFIKQSDNKVNIYIDGIAASGASVIAMAADKIYMPSNTNMMIHRASASMYGNADDFLKQAATLEKIDKSVLESYMGRFVGSKDELIKLISKETWLTAEECVTFGLADVVLKESEDNSTAEDVDNNIKENLFNKYKKDFDNKKDKGKPDNKSGLFNAFKN